MKSHNGKQHVKFTFILILKNMTKNMTKMEVMKLLTLLNQELTMNLVTLRCITASWPLPLHVVGSTLSIFQSLTSKTTHQILYAV